MKILILSIAAVTGVLSACDNSTSDKKDTNSSTVQTTVSNPDSTTKQNHPTITTDTVITVSIKEILNSYLQMKNAFAKDNDKSAADAANEMTKSL